MILTKTYKALPFATKEILRYAGCKTADDGIAALLDTCLKEVQDKLVYKVCYRELPIFLNDNICDFGVFSVHSQNLAANLKDAKKVVLFAATVGIEIDRLIARYSRISPSKALMFQAIGAEGIESLCNTFCKDLARQMGVGLSPRFSPGYGDLPLDTQKNIFSVLDCPKQIGLSLNNSLLISPSKSVTAFTGICEK